MDNKEKTVSEYTEEMMKMYKNSKPEAAAEKDEKQEEIPQNTEVKEGKPKSKEESSILTETTLVTGCGNEAIFTEKGFLRVKVTTGSGSIPIENAKVTVTYYKGSEYCFVGSYLTDASGQTQIIELPAPSKATSEKPNLRYPSALYDIAVNVEGYYDIYSRDVPVFEGITSLQNVNVIPVSAGYKSSDGETIYNNSSLE